jgi:hypothetical protein
MGMMKLPDRAIFRAVAETSGSSWAPCPVKTRHMPR